MTGIIEWMDRHDWSWGCAALIVCALAATAANWSVA